MMAQWLSTLFNRPGRSRQTQSKPSDPGPFTFIPHEGGLFSNFNFMVGEMYLGRIVYPLFSYKELSKRYGALQQFAYVDSRCDNSWFEFFQPIAYSAGDQTHLDTKRLFALPSTWGEPASPEFRLPAATMRLYAGSDFATWRLAVHGSIADKIRVTDEIGKTVDQMIGRMRGRRVGIHVRHPAHFVEQGDVFFRDYFQAIDAIRKRYPESSLFLATDNELALNMFQSRYRDALAFYPAFIRQSADSILEWAYSMAHDTPDAFGFVGARGFQTHQILAATGCGADGIRAGKEAVTDLFTLAACDDFVCTASNFTLACSFLNPNQQLHLVSKGASYRSMLTDLARNS